MLLQSWPMLTFVQASSTPRTTRIAMITAAAILTAACGTTDVPGATNGDAGSHPAPSPGTDAAAAIDATTTGDDDSNPDAGGAPDSATFPGDDAADDATLQGTVSDAGVITGAPIIGQLLGLTKPCSGDAIVSKHTYLGDNGKPVDICKLNGAVYYTAKMAIDCDGKTTPHCPGTGADKDCCYYNDTSFHTPKGEPLSAEYDPYVVIPQDFFYPGLDQNNGGNIIAVIYHDQLEFAVFGDQGPTDLIGESSFRTAANLGINSSPASGGVDGDVTYIVFTGTGVQPTDLEDQTQIQKLGASLVKQLVSQNP
jgi:hypothetical protein